VNFNLESGTLNAELRVAVEFIEKGGELYAKT
jgi:hypothetical protein